MAWCLYVYVYVYVCVFKLNWFDDDFGFRMISS